MIFKESHLEDPIYNAALDLIERELKIAHANQKIDSEELEQYKNVTREIIYSTPKQDLGHATKVLYDSIQKNLLGMEEVMGLPQRYFAPAIYNGIIDEVSCFNKISADESKKYLQNLGITKESVVNWMRKGGFKKEDLSDKRVWEMIGSVADEDFVDPFLNLPYPVYVQGKKESEKKKKLKKFGAIASTALLIGVPAASLGYVVEKLPGKIFHVYSDFDLDDIPNSWEDAHGLNKWDHSDAKNDFDHDGYTNLQEYLLGLDPKNPDCDGDGLLDGDDPDRDNMTSWFERNIAHLDPLTPNDRYVLLINPVKFDLGIFDGVISKLVNQKTDKQYDFFHNKMRIPKQNIIDLRYPNATYENFVKAVDKISNISDENDIVYISLNGHGGYDLFFFNGDDSNSIQFYEDIIYLLDKIPSKEQYLQIGSCHSGSAIEEIKSLGSGSLRGGCPWKFGNSPEDLLCYINSDSNSDGLSAHHSVPRVIITSSSWDELTYWFPLTDSIYPSVTGSPHILYINPHLPIDTHIPLPFGTNPDKDRNHFVSVREAFQDLVYTRKSLKDHPILKKITRKQHPQIYDPYNISGDLYFGEYYVKK